MTTDAWIEREHGLVIPSRDWLNMPKHLRREMRYGRVEGAFHEMLGLLGWAKAVTENPLLGGTASQHSNTTQTTYNSGTFTATAGSVQIAVISGQQAFGSASIPTVSGWTQLNTQTSSTYTTTTFWAQVSGSQNIAFVFPVNRTSATWQIMEFAGCDPTTPINTNKVAGSGTSATPSVTLPNAFVNSSSGVFAWCGTVADTVAITAGSGYTGIYDYGDGTAFNNVRLMTEWRNSNSTTATTSMLSSQAYSMFACELAAPASGATFFKFYKNMLGGFASPKHGLGRGS